MIRDESFTINGVYLENVIPGYSTIKTLGRERLEKEIETITNKRDGSVVKSTRFPSRTITVDFVLKGSSMQDLREKLTTLNSLLKVEGAVFVFNDEPSVFYVGTPTLTDDMKDAKNSAIGSFDIFCADPFKYAADETEIVGVLSDNTLVFATDYDEDAYPTYPRLEVQFASDTSGGAIGGNADCGYVMLSKVGTDHSLQFGDDEEQDTGTQTLLSADFVSASRTGWTDASLPLPGDRYTIPSGATTVFGSPGMRGSVFGTVASKYHGPLCVKDLGTNVSGEFELTWQQILALNGTATTGKKQGGGFGIMLYDSSNVLQYSLLYVKSGTTTLTGGVRFYDAENGLRDVATNVSMAYTGPTGYTSNASGVPAKKSTNTIRRYQDEDGLWYLSINTTLYKNDRIGGWETAPNIRKIGFFFAQYGTTPKYTTNALCNARFSVGDVDLINTFTSGDRLDVDVATMDVKLNGADASNIGDITNSWTQMTVEAGDVNFALQWSEWLNASYAPSASLFYRKRWL